MDRPTIYEYAGGAPAFLALATDFHARCLADPVLNHPFSHADQNPQHVPRLAAYWGEVFGGPPAHTDHSAVLHLHAHQGMFGDIGERFLGCFVAAADAAGMPKETHDYMRWAVADIMQYDPPDTVVPDGVPVPRWGWDGPISR